MPVGRIEGAAQQLSTGRPLLPLSAKLEWVSSQRYAQLYPRKLSKTVDPHEFAQFTHGIVVALTKSANEDREGAVAGVQGNSLVRAMGGSLCWKNEVTEILNNGCYAK